MDRYLTVEECAAELRVTRVHVLKLLQQQLLVGIQVTPGHWRILDPAPKLRERLLEVPLDRAPFISPKEAAEVLGMALNTMEWYIQRNRANPVRLEGGPHYRVFSVKELRRFAATREKRKGPGRLTYSVSIVKWLKAYLAQDLASTAEAIQMMLDKAVQLPEPDRSQKIVEIWALLDRLDLVLKSSK